MTLLRNFCKYLPIAFILLLAGCGDDETARLSDAEYFPMRKGFYQVYSITKTTYSAVNPVKHEVYELKTEVVDSFLNDIGSYTYVIYRSKRETENDSWQFLDSWSARTTPFQAVLTEGNISYVVLLFPASVNARWNGNLLNSHSADEYTITSSGKPYQLSTGETIPDCVEVLQQVDRDFLIRDERNEVYSRNIGLIYKKIIDVNYCSNPQAQNCQFGTDFIIDGVEYEQVLKSYGQH